MGDQPPKPNILAVLYTEALSHAKHSAIRGLQDAQAKDSCA